MKELTCIVCPRGCRLRVDEEHDYAVTGNSCPRGAEYGRREVTAPTRVVTSTVRCTGGVYPRCPVKTDRPVPKELVFAVMDAVNAVSAANMALAGVTFRIPCDEVIDAMRAVGDAMAPSLKETGTGGLAATPTGRKIAQSVLHTGQKTEKTPQS